MWCDWPQPDKNRFLLPASFQFSHSWKENFTVVACKRVGNNAVLVHCHLGPKLASEKNVRDYCLAKFPPHMLLSPTQNNICYYNIASCLEWNPANPYLHTILMHEPSPLTLEVALTWITILQNWAFSAQSTAQGGLTVRFWIKPKMSPVTQVFALSFLGVGDERAHQDFTQKARRWPLVSSGECRTIDPSVMIEVTVWRCSLS